LISYHELCENVLHHGIVFVYHYCCHLWTHLRRISHLNPKLPYQQNVEQAQSFTMAVSESELITLFDLEVQSIDLYGK